jgi:predicted RND superfamily exporter protein
LQNNLLDNFPAKNTQNIITNFIQLYKNKGLSQIYDHITVTKELSDKDAAKILDEFKEYISKIKN